MRAPFAKALLGCLIAWAHWLIGAEAAHLALDLDEKNIRDLVATRSAPDFVELRAYLARSFPAAVTRVAANADEIRIEGVAGAGPGELFLAESPIWQHLTREAPLARVAALRPAADGSFAVGVPRLADGEAGPRDRLFSRWLVVRARPGGDEQLSAPATPMPSSRGMPGRRRRRARKKASAASTPAAPKSSAISTRSASTASR